MYRNWRVLHAGAHVHGAVASGSARERYHRLCFIASVAVLMSLQAARSSELLLFYRLTTLNTSLTSVTVLAVVAFFPEFPPDCGLRVMEERG